MKTILSVIVCCACAIAVGSEISPIIRVLAGGLWSSVAMMVVMEDKE